MWFTSPIWLLALLIIIPLLFSGNILIKKRNNKSLLYGGNFSKNSAEIQIKRLTILRTVVIVLVIFALAGASALLPTKSRKIALLIDVSDSVGTAQVEKAKQELRKRIHDLNRQDRVTLIAFAGHPRVVFPFSAPDEASLLLDSASLEAPDKSETDLDSAILTASGMLSGSFGNKSIFLFSDGRPTEGGSIDQALRKISGVQIYTIPIGLADEGMFSKAVKLPETAHLGEKSEAVWSMVSTTDQKVSVIVKENGRILQKKNVEIKKGLNRVPVIFNADRTGNRRIDFELADEGGRSIPGMESSGLINVEGKASILLIHGKILNPALPDALRLQNIDVQIEDSRGIIEETGSLNAYSAVVLDDVPAAFLSEKQQEVLRSYVAGGGGLFVIGGNSSLGRGEYFNSDLGELLPVSTDTRQRFIFNRAEIIFVLDHSGSMSEKVGNTTKYAATLSGVAAAVKKLNPNDQVAIIAFDDQVNWVLPLTPAGKLNEILKALSRIVQGGGTDMGKAFESVIGLFPTQEPVLRHMIVITDGETIEADFQSLSRKLRDSGFSITTIGIGNEINETLLQNIAVWGKGKFYKVSAEKIPHIIENETVRATRELIQEGKFTPSVKTQAGFISGFYRGVPPIKGYLLTRPKSLATVYLEAGDDDPLLASWRYGNGKTAVFTADSGSRWLSGWLGKEYYNYLFSQTIRYIERGTSDKGLRVSATVEASTAHLVVNAIDKDRRLRTGLQLTGRSSEGAGYVFLFNETAPGRYEADVPVTNTGLYVFDIHENGGEKWTTGWVWNPYGKEFGSTGPDLPSLSRISSQTGGKTLSLKRIIFPAAGWGFEPASLQNILLILALISFVIELFLRSTSMNQIKMAKAVISVWWSIKAAIIHKAYTVSEMSEGERAKLGKTIELEREQAELKKTREAFRYLAQRSHSVQRSQNTKSPQDNTISQDK